MRKLLFSGMFFGMCSGAAMAIGLAPLHHARTARADQPTVYAVWEQNGEYRWEPCGEKPEAPDHFDRGPVPGDPLAGKPVDQPTLRDLQEQAKEKQSDTYSAWDDVYSEEYYFKYGYQYAAPEDRYGDGLDAAEAESRSEESENASSYKSDYEYEIESPRQAVRAALFDPYSDYYDEFGQPYEEYWYKGYTGITGDPLSVDAYDSSYQYDFGYESGDASGYNSESEYEYKFAADGYVSETSQYAGTGYDETDTDDSAAYDDLMFDEGHGYDAYYTGQYDEAEDHGAGDANEETYEYDGYDWDAETYERWYTGEEQADQSSDRNWWTGDESAEAEDAVDEAGADEVDDAGDQWQYESWEYPYYGCQADEDRLEAGSEKAAHAGMDVDYGRTGEPEMTVAVPHSAVGDNFDAQNEDAGAPDAWSYDDEWYYQDEWYYDGSSQTATEEEPEQSDTPETAENGESNSGGEWTYEEEYGFEDAYGYEARTDAYRYDWDRAESEEAGADAASDSTRNEAQQDEYSYRYEYDYDYIYDAYYGYTGEESAAAQRDASDEANVVWSFPSDPDVDPMGSERDYEAEVAATWMAGRYETAHTDWYNEQEYLWDEWEVINEQDSWTADPAFSVFDTPLEGEPGAPGAVYDIAEIAVQSEPAADEAKDVADPQVDDYYYADPYEYYGYDYEAYYGSGAMSHEGGTSPKAADGYDAEGEDRAIELDEQSSHGLESGLELFAWHPAELLTPEDQQQLGFLEAMADKSSQARRRALGRYIDQLGFNAQDLADRFERQSGIEVQTLADDLPGAAAFFGVYRLVEQGELGMGEGADLLRRTLANLRLEWIEGVMQLAAEHYHTNRWNVSVEQDSYRSASRPSLSHVGRILTDAGRSLVDVATASWNEGKAAAVASLESLVREGRSAALSGGDIIAR